MISYY